ncbi:MAG: hypothetical protein JJV95_06725, partial [Sulfurospirillum sp.]|nr:hypothetical protein [Sulfurospirillum sp.]
LETTVMSISYNYSFNNQGIRRGFYLGAGLSSVKTEIVDNILITQASESGTGLLLRGGYEYQTDNNLLLDIGFNMHTAEQDLKYDYKGKYEDIEGSTTTSLSNFGISLSYIF